MEIVVPAPVALADDVAALLADRVPEARRGAEIRADAVVFWTGADDVEEALARARAAVADMAAAGLAVDAAAVHAAPAAPESEWRDAWKKHFHVERVTDRIVIVPSWEHHDASSGDVVVELDPGRAFGTGQHATTRLVLEELDALAAAGTQVRRFADVGTGSGVLAIAAAALWPAATGDAVDIDPMAVRAARENLEANGAGDRVACATTPAGELDGAYDLVLANIQSSVLHHLRDALCALVTARGVLLLSGIMTPQADGVAATYADDAFELEAVRASQRDPAWTVVRLRRR